MSEETSSNENLELSEQGEMFGHPKGLFYLFFAEMWERFSFYGMRALLVLYLSTQLFKDLMNGEEVAFSIYAAYGALVYFTPAIGGMLADRIIGKKNSVMLGGILMCIGHFTMAFESESIFFLSLGLLIIGNGFFKPNISTLVGNLYNEGDKRRDAGFTIFYMGINLGAFLSPLVCGWLGHSYGWHYGFAAAGIGMLAGIVVFWRGDRKNVFGDQGHQPAPYNEKKYGGFNILVWIYAAAFASVPLFAFLVNKSEIEVPFVHLKLMEFLLWSLLSLVIIYLVYLSATKLNKSDIKKLGAIIVLTFFITIFWSFFEQAGSSLTLFAEKNVDLVLLNAAQTNSINAGYIILLAVPFSMMWVWLDKKRKNPNTTIKFGLGILQLGLGFLVFAMSAPYMGTTGLVPMMFLMLGYLLITTGELFASPIGLSKVTELSPAFLVSFMMGVWFLSSSFAHHISGVIAKMTIPTVSETEYVQEDNIFFNFATWASGCDQNAVGKFNYEYDKAHGAIVDTNIHWKSVSIESDGSTTVLKKETFGPISKYTDSLSSAEITFKASDTLFTINEAKVKYPETAQLNSYNQTFNLMDSVNESWVAAKGPIVEASDKITPTLTTLNSFTERNLILDYHRYNQVFQEKANMPSFEEAYDLLSGKDTTLTVEERKHELEKITPKWKLKAEKLIALETSMVKENAEWAEAAFEFNSALENHKRQVAPIRGLATYAKIFAQIALISFMFAILAFIVSPIMRKWMQGIK